MSKQILILPGDGIGPDIMAEAVKVLRRVDAMFGLGYELVFDSIGGAAYEEHGSPLSDQTLARAQAARVNAQRFGHAGAQIVHQNVALRGQLLECSQARGSLQVYGDRPLAAIEDVEIQRVPLPKRASHAPCIIASLRALQLDHVGAHVAHYLGCVGPSHEPRQIQHLDTDQGAIILLGHSGTLAWPAAINCPCASLVANLRARKRASSRLSSSSTRA